MIFPIWQKLGQSTHQLAQACGQALNQQVTHTGTLDPMAEGVVVMLSDMDRFAKGNLPDWLKTYHFSILWGVATDSGDRLGIISTTTDAQPTESQVQEVLQNFPATYNQHIPAFSARRLQGTSSFELAKAQQPIPPQTRQVTLRHLSFLSSEHLTTQKILTAHHDVIHTVHGNFRQQEVIKSWQQHVSQQSFLITHHSVTTSPGTYIRQLVQDLAAQLGTPATTWSITRTQNGPYEHQDCVDIDELSQLSLDKS